MELALILIKLTCLLQAVNVVCVVLCCDVIWSTVVWCSVLQYVFVVWYLVVCSAVQCTVCAWVGVRVYVCVQAMSVSRCIDECNRR